MTLPDELRVAWRRIPSGSERRTVSRALLGELLPGATFSSRCPRCGGGHGRVQVSGADAAVSVSYAGGWAIVAIAAGEHRIGVDAVVSDPPRLERVLPDSAGARDWARVEAVLKADGRGLRVDPGAVEVVDADRTGAWHARVDGGREWLGWDTGGPPGLVVAVALDAAGSAERR